MSSISFLRSFPFCIREENLGQPFTYWDGTFPRPPASVGPGTVFPIGLTLEQLTKLYWRTRFLTLELNYESTVSTGTSFALSSQLKMPMLRGGGSFWGGYTECTEPEDPDEDPVCEFIEEFITEESDFLSIVCASTPFNTGFRGIGEGSPSILSPATPLAPEGFFNPYASLTGDNLFLYYALIGGGGSFEWVVVKTPDEKYWPAVLFEMQNSNGFFLSLKEGSNRVNVGGLDFEFSGDSFNIPFFTIWSNPSPPQETVSGTINVGKYYTYGGLYDENTGVAV